MRLLFGPCVDIEGLVTWDGDTTWDYRAVLSSDGLAVVDKNDG